MTPIGDYFRGHGDKVMQSMKSRYGDKEGERVFYATANKENMNRPGKRDSKKRGKK